MQVLSPFESTGARSRALTHLAGSSPQAARSTSLDDAVTIGAEPETSAPKSFRIKKAIIAGGLLACSFGGASNALAATGTGSPTVAAAMLHGPDANAGKTAPQATFGQIVPRQATSTSAFALGQAERESVLKQVPAVNSAEGQKLLALMNQVYVGRPATPAPPSADPSRLRVVDWNINDPDTADRIAAALQGDVSALGDVSARAGAELSQVANADVYNLQEIPLPVAARLAEKLGYHVVWAPEFIELAKGAPASAGDKITGNAILSRYELSDPRILRFHQQADWYKEEIKGVPLPETVIRRGAKVAFGEGVPNHEVRLPAPFGGRAALSATVSVPGQAPMRIADLHLENHAKPALRRHQMQEVIDMVKASPLPVFFGGDLNTLDGDGRIQTVGREISGQFDTKVKVAEKAASVGFQFVPYAGWAKDGFDAYKFVKTRHDPTSVMNREHQIFRDVEHQLGVMPLNERGAMGYKTTWSTPHPHVVGNAVLDWTWLYDPGHTGVQVTQIQTLSRMVAESGHGDTERISDHFPQAIDLRMSH